MGSTARLERNEEKFPPVCASANLRKQLIGRGYTDRGRLGKDKTRPPPRPHPGLNDFLDNTWLIVSIHTARLIYRSKQAAAEAASQQPH